MDHVRKTMRIHQPQSLFIALALATLGFSSAHGCSPSGAIDPDLTVSVDGVETHVAPGAPIYRQRCIGCHQMDGGGVGGTLAADFTSAGGVLTKSDSELLSSIRDGVSGTSMIGWSDQLSFEEQRQVLAYIRWSFGD